MDADSKPQFYQSLPGGKENDMIALKKTPALGTIFSGAAILAALTSFTVASAHGDDDNASILSTGQKSRQLLHRALTSSSSIQD
jgi:hypothetical protein